jgi:hypothetical protein
MKLKRPILVASGINDLECFPYIADPFSVVVSKKDKVKKVSCIRSDDVG